MVPDTDITAQDLYRANFIYDNESERRKPYPIAMKPFAISPCKQIKSSSRISWTRYLVSISVPLELVLV